MDTPSFLAYIMLVGKTFAKRAQKVVFCGPLRYLYQTKRESDLFDKSLIPL